MTKSSFEGRPALVLANDRLELTVLPQGGAMVKLLRRQDAEKINPMWDPARMAREAGEEPRFGAAAGHFVCVDGFGPVSPEERAAGLPGHGEAHLQPWELKYSGKEGNTASLTLSARLPLVAEVFTRTLRMIDGEEVVYIHSELESLLPFDRPVCWAEHATIGSPFLEPGVTVVDMPAKRAKTRPHEAGSGVRHRLPSGREFTWPMAPALAGGRIDLRAAPASLGTGDHTTCLMDPARKLVFVTALHTGKGLLFGYVFRPSQFPWVQNWEHYPASGRLARGLEFGAQPFDAPRREAIQTNSLFDAPTYRWLPARSKIEARFLMFYTRAPSGFRKVDDVRQEGATLVIEDRKAGKRITLAASGAL